MSPTGFTQVALLPRHLLFLIKPSIFSCLILSRVTGETWIQSQQSSDIPDSWPIRGRVTYRDQNNHSHLLSHLWSSVQLPQPNWASIYWILWGCFTLTYPQRAICNRRQFGTNVEENVNIIYLLFHIKTHSLPNNYIFSKHNVFFSFLFFFPLTFRKFPAVMA